jgi:uncharacterized NAD(P)/FAD-binding protein YdhS
MSRSVNTAIVIGAGLSGTLLTLQLARQLPEGSRVLLIGSPGEIGRGLAYRAAPRDLLLNVPVKGLSADPDTPDDFYAWLGGRGHADDRPDPEGFAARAEYGDYLRDRLQGERRRVAGCVAIEIVEDNAVELTRSGSLFEVRLAGGGRYRGEAAALCLGNAPPVLRIPEGAADAAALERSIVDPWNDPRIHAVGEGDRVLFLGAGLTMIDHLLLLHARGYRGNAVALSRHGLLPAMHASVPVGSVEPDLGGAPGLRLLARRVIAEARRQGAEGGDWRAIVDGLRPHAQGIWQGLLEPDRRRFRRHLESFWSVHRHRMAPEIGARLDNLLAQGALAVMAGHLVSVRRSADRLKVALRRRGSDVTALHSFDWIVNCTGPGRMVGHARNPLVTQMLADGIVTADRFGLGIEVDAASAVLGRPGRPCGGLYALGPLTAGRFWEITAVREIRSQAAAVARRIAADVAAAPAGDLASAFGMRLRG